MAEAEQVCNIQGGACGCEVIENPHNCHSIFYWRKGLQDDGNRVQLDACSYGCPTAALQPGNACNALKYTLKLVNVMFHQSSAFDPNDGRPQVGMF